MFGTPGAINANALQTRRDLTHGPDRSGRLHSPWVGMRLNPRHSVMSKYSGKSAHPFKEVSVLPDRRKLRPKSDEPGPKPWPSVATAPSTSQYSGFDDDAETTVADAIVTFRTCNAWSPETVQLTGAAAAGTKVTTVAPKTTVPSAEDRSLFLVVTIHAVPYLAESRFF
jgi:hypothetical protein